MHSMTQLPNNVNLMAFLIHLPYNISKVASELYEMINERIYIVGRR